MATSDLVLRIIGQDQASPAFNQVAGASKRLDAANKQVVTSQSRTHRAFSATAKILTGLATGYAGIKIKQFVGESITAASDLNEAMSATDQVFKKQSNAVKQWSTTSVQSFGQTRTQALNTARQYGTLFKSAGLGGKELRTYSTTLTELASDIASFNNVPVQQAIDDMTSGLSGQVEPMRKYGVFLSANALKAEAMRMGIAKGTETLTDQQRTLAAYNLILRQTGVTSDKYAKQSGDFQRTAAGYANQTRILAANWQSVKGAFGQAILPLATSVVTNLNQVLPKVTKSLTDGDLGDALEGMVPKVEGFFSSFSDNLPELKSIASDFGDAFGIIGRGLEGVFNTFNSLPDGVRQGIILLGTAAATMKMLNRAAGGGGMTMFSQAVESIPHAVVRSGASVAAAEAVKAVFGNRIGTMQIQAGVVNVNGGKVNGGGGPGGGAAGKGAGAAGGGALTLIGGTAGGVLIAAGIVAAINKGIESHYGRTATANATRQRAIGASNLGDGSQRGSQYSTSSSGIRQPNLPSNAGRWKAEADGIRKTKTESDSLARTMHGVVQGYTDWKGAAKSAKFEGVGGAVAVAGAIKKIPDKKTTRISTPGADESKGKIKGLGGAIGGLKGKTVPVKESGADSSRSRVNTLKGSIGALRGKQVKVSQTGAEQAKTAIDNMRTTLALLQSKTITINTRYTTSGGGPGKQALVASGGWVRGPGTSTSDDIPAMLSDGEFVQPTASVNHYGVGFMEAIRTRRFPRPAGYKVGGQVTKADADKAKKRAEEIAKQISAAKREAKRQQRLARFIQTEDLSDPAADWLTSQDPAVQKRFMKRPNQIGRFARMAGAVQDRRAERDAQRSRDQATAARGLAGMDVVTRKNTLAERVAQTNKELSQTKGPAARARLLAKLQEQEDQLAQATQDVTEAERAQQEQREAAQDAALEKVNALRDAVDSASGSYRSFASIATTSVTDVADAQQKLTDSNDAVAAAQKKMDIAGSERERAAAAAELAKALKEQQSAQQGVAAAGKPTSGSIRGNMASRLQKLRDFSSAVKTLKGQGLNPVTLSELMQMGPEQGYDFAKALLDGGLADINALQNQITAEAASLGYAQYSTDAAAASMTGFAAAQAAGLTSGGLVIAPAPVTLTLDGATIASALVAFARQNGGSIPGLTPG